MIEAIPLPPSFPIPGAFEIPSPSLSQPQLAPLEWEPVPVYIEDVPQELVPPNPTPQAADDLLDDELEDEAEEGSKEGPDDSENNNEGAQGTEPIAPVDIIPEIAEVQTFEIPLVGIEVPVPRAEILTTAATTAGISSFVAVGGTLFATTLFRQLQPLLKPIFKKIFKKMAEVRKKPPPLTWARERLISQRKLKAQRQNTVDKKGNQG